MVKFIKRLFKKKHIRGKNEKEPGKDFSKYSNLFNMLSLLKKALNNYDGYNLFIGLENPIFDNENYNNFEQEEKEKVNLIIENIIDEICLHKSDEKKDKFQIVTDEILSISTTIYKIQNNIIDNSITLH